ncbi:diguanylate cyclase [Hydrogenimonas sp. SS33]|uniref:diguanylate cyclase n=1 Tax=Hydrogenimonas leucolamina TaxID=2954236 RepID=UPI00336BDC72
MNRLPIKVLYIEGDEQIRQATAAHLEKHVEDLFVAREIDTALNFLEKHNPDLLITDIDLPGTAALDFIRHARSRREDLPVLVTTDFTDKADLTEAIREGVNTYIHKRSEPERMLEVVRDCFKFTQYPFLTLQVDFDGKILHISDLFSRYLGYDGETLRGEAVEKIVKPLGNGNAFCLSEILRTEKEEREFSAIFRKRDGSDVVLNGRGRTKRDDRGLPCYETTWHPLECLLHSYREMNERLGRESYLKALMHFHAVIGREAILSDTTERFLNRVLEEIPESIDAGLSGFIMLGERELHLLHTTPECPVDLPGLFPVALEPWEREAEKEFLPLCLAARHNEIVFIDDIELLPDPAFRNALLPERIKTVIVLPISRTASSRGGLLVLMFRAHHRFNKEELDLWQNIADTISFGLTSVSFRMERDALIDRLDRIAHTDSLTGVINRHRGMELIRHEITRCLRYGSRFSIIFFDIDNFKTINDTYGHAMGDEVLIKVAQLVQNSLRRTDALIRWGGEEFLILLPETGCNDAVSLAQKLRRTIEERGSGLPFSVTASFGIAEWNRELSLDALISRADGKMYEAKRQGRNRIVY